MKVIIHTKLGKFEVRPKTTGEFKTPEEYVKNWYDKVGNDCIKLVLVDNSRGFFFPESIMKDYVLEVINE